ncbi:transketolase family protein [Enterocloster lavalensis]|uniref:transketolase family protein n=1 Tax=Enterocloster lavalensis TaxID=460384 RepID=UPI001D06863E|nr:transketolase C-terminal domain-containing protein [Enterocloster lavalensis]MCB6345827.1 transketolase family protein [Enterocloster lavalensis]
MENRYTGEKPELEVAQVINKTLRELIKEDSRVVYLDADLMGSLKTHDLWHEFPDNVFNTGIQEANMIGVACGMYLNGMKPYVHSFAPFVSRRAFDQVFLSIAYAKKSVRIIASDAGIMATHNGGTHMCFEDIAMMRSVPEACVVDVSDPMMCGEFLKLTKERPGVTFIRAPRRDLPDIYLPGTVFEEGKGKILREGNDVTLIGCGIMVGTCLQAAGILAQEGIEARVVDIVTIKPLDQELVLECAMKTGGIVTAENANVIGGLGSAVSEYLAEVHPTRVLRVGIEDIFGRVGVESGLREAYGLTPEKIASKARKIAKQ